MTYIAERLAKVRAKTAYNYDAGLEFVRDLIKLPHANKSVTTTLLEIEAELKRRKGVR